MKARNSRREERATHANPCMRGSRRRPSRQFSRWLLVVLAVHSCFAASFDPATNTVFDAGGALETQAANSYAAGPVDQYPGPDEDFTIEGYIFIPTEHRYISVGGYLFFREGFADIYINSPLLESYKYQIFFGVATGEPKQFEGPLFGRYWHEIENGWHHWACVNDSIAGEQRIYLDGVITLPGIWQTVTLGNITPPLDQAVIGGKPSNNAEWAWGFYWDEVRVSRSARYSGNFDPPARAFAPDADTVALWHFDEPTGATEFDDASGNGYTLTGVNGAMGQRFGNALPITVTVEPFSQTNSAGATAIFNGIVEGGDPVSYQWQKDGLTLIDGGNIAGAVAPTLNVSNLTKADEGEYTLTITIETESFTSAPAVLVVHQPNREPQIVSPGPQIVPEETLFEMTLDVIELDPGSQLVFSLAGGPPDMVVDTASGRLTWTPTEEQGPSTNLVTATVMDDGTPPLSNSVSFVVTVLESNMPPRLEDLDAVAVWPGESMNLSLHAEDPDWPANDLVLTLIGNTQGATVLPGGEGWATFEWTPGDEDAGTNSFTIRVEDNGLPPMSDEQTLVVVVRHPTRVTLEPTIIAEGGVELTFTGDPGRTYVLEISTDLENWTTLTDTLATEPRVTMSDTSPATERQRYYRVVSH
ncbi:MAG: hypothetical protein KJ072_00210 [Verrucomicrobia bacterium]|nr:hypothetical protein [Verrucomicrobiota bacterium]